MNASDVLTLKVVGSRGGATRVRIDAMRGSWFNGETGTIAKLLDEDHVLVRLDRPNCPELPFAISELHELPVARPGR